jgi:hypothetical protein
VFIIILIIKNLPNPFFFIKNGEGKGKKKTKPGEGAEQVPPCAGLVWVILILFLVLIFFVVSMATLDIHIK